MTKTRREFTPEFKREAVVLLDRSGRPLKLKPEGCLPKIYQQLCS